MTLDPDRASRAAHRDPRLVALVFAGGTVGTAVRAALGAVASSPATTVVINVSGSFLLGLLVAVLLRRGPETPRIRAVRLTLGTGLLGGYTTYSTMALDIATLGLGAGASGALLVALLTVVGGYLAALVGLVAGGWRG